MIMAPGLRKFALVTHVTSSVSVLGAIAGFLALALTGLTSQDLQLVRAVYAAMDVTASFVILPLVIAALVTGLVQSLGTAWGLFRHYWVLAKLLITLVVTIVLLLQMEAISYVAAMAAQPGFSIGDLSGMRKSLAIHAGGGLLALLLPVVLSLYKPAGVTRYGWNKQHGRRRFGQAGIETNPRPSR